MIFTENIKNLFIQSTFLSFGDCLTEWGNEALTWNGDDEECVASDNGTHQLLLEMMAAESAEPNVLPDLNWGYEDGPEAVELANISLIDDIMGQLWLEYSYTERWWRVYRWNDSSISVILYWGISGIPNDKTITVEEIISRILDNQWLNSEQSRIFISETIDGISIPEKVFQGYDYTSVNDLSDIGPYLEAYESISLNEYKELKDTIVSIIYSETWVLISNDFSITNNIVRSWDNLTLNIDGKYLNRGDDQFWIIKNITVRFNGIPDISIMH